MEPDRSQTDTVPQTPRARSRAIIWLLVTLGLIGLAVTTRALSTVVIVFFLLVIIMLHELGHYVMARRADMKITEFFLGFGPRLWSTRKGETEYGVKAIPVGGYVRIIGMHNLEVVDPADESRAYRSKPYRHRLSVAVAGSTVHFILALALLFSIFAGFETRFSFRPEDPWKVGAVIASTKGASPAEKAGFRPGDRIIEVDGRSAGKWMEVVRYLGDRPGDRVNFVVERGGRQVELSATLASRTDKDTKIGFLGIEPRFDRHHPLVAASESLKKFGDFTVGSVQGLTSFFTPSNLREYASRLTDAPEGKGVDPNDDNRFISLVGFVRVTSQANEQGVAEVLLLLALINIFVGWFNLIPLLPLDGGHVAIATYEKIRSLMSGRRYHADVAKLLPLTYAVVMVLVIIGVTALWLDIVSPLQNPYRQ